MISFFRIRSSEIYFWSYKISYGQDRWACAWTKNSFCMLYSREQRFFIFHTLLLLSFIALKWWKILKIKILFIKLEPMVLISVEKVFSEITTWGRNTVFHFSHLKRRSYPGSKNSFCSLKNHFKWNFQCYLNIYYCSISICLHI